MEGYSNTKVENSDKKKRAIKRFKTIAIIEGISFLVLLFIAMPLKYFADIPEVVTYVGWMHGVLFMAYMLSLLQVKLVNALPWKQSFIAGFASVIPFGPFIFDKKIFKTEII